MRGKRPHECADAASWSRARHREAVLRPLAGRSQLSQTIVRDAVQRIGVSRAHFYRLLAAYKLRSQTSTLLRRPDGQIGGTHRLPVEIESLVHQCIEEFYMSRVRPSVAALIRAISQECRRAAVSVPNYRTIQRRLATYDPKEVSRARFGAKAASKAAPESFPAMSAVAGGSAERSF